MTVYVDVLFAVNAVMDFATLLAAARLGGVFARRWRVLLAALAGGGYAVCSVLWAPSGGLLLRVVAGVLLCWIAYGRKTAFVRVCALYFVVSAAFAGLAMALGAAAGRQLLLGAGFYFAVPLKTLLLAAAVGYAVSGVLLRGDAAHGAVRREVEILSVRFLEKETQVRVLQDTGNDLTEPVTGRPVIVLGKEAACRLLGARASVLEGLTAGNAASRLTLLPPELARRFGLLPYQAVGTEGGLLLYFRPDAVQRADGTVLDCVLAVRPERMERDGYEGLIGV